MRPKEIGLVFRDAAISWNNDNVWRLGAALAYFTVFALAPLLLIVIATLGIVFGQDAAQGRVVAQISGLVGVEGGRMVETMIKNVYLSGANIPATIVGVVSLLLGASAVFVELRSDLNLIWHIEPKPIGTVWGFLRDRFLSLALILGIGFLLLVSLSISAGLSAFSEYISNRLTVVASVLDVVISFIGIAIVIGAIFKFLPAVTLKWRDLWVGAAVTSFLFSIGKIAIGVYLGASGVASTFGAASSLVIVILWTFYSTQIVLFGAEFTKVFAMRSTH